MLPPKNHCQRLKAGILQALNWRLRLNFTLWTGRGYACTYILNKVTARHTKLASFPEICKLRGFWFGVTWFCAICTRLRWTFTRTTFKSELTSDKGSLFEQLLQSTSRYVSLFTATELTTIGQIGTALEDQLSLGNIICQVDRADTRVPQFRPVIRNAVSVLAKMLKNNLLPTIFSTVCALVVIAV